MENISDRHEGDLQGQLTAFTDLQPVAVAVVLDPRSAHLPGHQHTAWMLVNLLTRAVGVVSAVHLVCPSGVPLAGRTVPLAPRDASLPQALLQGAEAIGAIPVSPAAGTQHADITLIVGDGDRAGHPRTRFVAGYGWWGGVSSRPLPVSDTYASSALPFGPYLSACLAAAEVFLAVRLPGYHAGTATYGWDSWDQSAQPAPAPGAPAGLEHLDLSGTALAGVGAVGSAWIHALWASPGLTGEVLLSDADPKGVTLTNLNRCTLFGRRDLGRFKATSAAQTAADTTILWRPHNTRFEQLGVTPNLLVSAVDTNRARAELQNRYAPMALSASTLDLRAETLRVARPAIDACLRCYNPPEILTVDDELRTRTRAGGPAAVKALADETDVSQDEVRRWLARGECGEVGTRLLESLRSHDEPPLSRFAVGFTSVMAGTLLATETAKTLTGQPMRPSSPAHTNLTFQFLNPTATVNATGRLARDPRCPACSPTHPAMNTWRHRAESAIHP
ncbi:ThiF family adenylyltransferase [Streptomyces sp. NPDC058642]|uniref:ThiF family adenylyltransferase n=1 Tax=Streptomyces sp. NPDC058642 TaxID=3346572 RepID=UPI00366440ED